MHTAQLLGLLSSVSAVLASTTAVLAMRRRGQHPAATALALAMGGLAWWAALEAVGLLFLTPLHRYTLTLGIYPGVGATVVGFFCLCRRAVDGDWRLGRRGVALLLVEPLLVSLVAATNSRHGLVMDLLHPGRLPELAPLTPGPAFWVHSVYSYGLLTWALIGVGRAWVDAPALQRRQLGILITAAAFPAVANGLTLVLLTRGYSFDLSPVGFLATGLIDSYALFQLGLMRLAPVARGLVLDRVGDAVVVIDTDNRILDLNPAAETLVRRMQEARGVLLPAVLVGRPARILRPTEHLVFPLQSQEITLEVGSRTVHFDLRVDPLTDRHGRALGRVLVLRDITELHERRRELAEANGRLQEQLRTIEALRHDLAEQAVRDELTGLHNRRYLHSALEADLARATVDRSAVSILLIDLDHFKLVNDQHGHAVGDDLLRAVAAALEETTRSADVVARYGGEEFVVLLPGAEVEAARARAEELRERVRAVAVLDTCGLPVSVTLSAGIATFPDCGRNPSQLLQEADVALYEAKAAGRDRVVCARTEHVTSPG